MPIQSTARSRARQVRRSGGTGARSRLLKAEVTTSGGSVLASPGVAPASAGVTAGCSFITQPFLWPDAPVASAPFVYWSARNSLPLTNPKRQRGRTLLKLRVSENYRWESGMALLIQNGEIVTA